MEAFDINRVTWEHDMFKPWTVQQTPIALCNAGLGANEILLVAERAGQRWGFWLPEVVYHHIIQGESAGKPYLITFCGVCNAGVMLDPVINGTLHHFREIGVYNGQQIFTDDETGSLWNHLTGTALHGPLAGQQMAVSYLKMSTVGDELQIDRELDLYFSRQHRWKQRVMQWIIKYLLGPWNKNWLPSHFERTMPTIDDRLPRMTMGIAVIDGNDVRFFPTPLYQKQEYRYQWDNRQLRLVSRDKLPYAEWANGERPYQLLTRWYAFVLAYPHGKLIGSVEEK